MVSESAVLGSSGNVGLGVFAVWTEGCTNIASFPDFKSICARNWGVVLGGMGNTVFGGILGGPFPNNVYLGGFLSIFVLGGFGGPTEMVFGGFEGPSAIGKVIVTSPNTFSMSRVLTPSDKGYWDDFYTDGEGDVEVYEWYVEFPVGTSLRTCLTTNRTFLT
mgnify:CR=1 FL=1